MNVDEFQLQGVMPIRGAVPGFATPLFGRPGSNQSWIQEFDGNEVIMGFLPIQYEEDAKVAWNTPPLARSAGQIAFYGFCHNTARIIVGTRGEIDSPLRDLIQPLLADKHPFIAHQIAKFVKDRQLVAHAWEQCELLLRPSVRRRLYFRIRDTHRLMYAEAIPLRTKIEVEHYKAPRECIIRVHITNVSTTAYKVFLPVAFTSTKNLAISRQNLPQRSLQEESIAPLSSTSIERKIALLPAKDYKADNMVASLAMRYRERQSAVTHKIDLGEVPISLKF